MKKLSMLFVLALSLSIFTAGCGKRRNDSNSNTGDSWVSTAPVSAEAKPVRNWLQSIKARDVELFKTVFSKRMQSTMEQQGWGRSLGVYTMLWTDKLGDYDLDELSFVFAPAELENDQTDIYSGQVTITKVDLSFPPIDVVYEEEGWKVDER